MVIKNYAGALLDIQSNRYWEWYLPFGARPVIQNEGTIRKTTAGEANLGQVQVNNDGQIDLTGNSMRINYYAQSGEVRLNDAAATLRLGGSANINAGSTFTGSGWIIIQGTTSLNTDVSILNLQLDNTLTGSGSLTVTRTLNWTGGAINGPGGPVTNLGTLNISGSADKTLQQRTLANAGTANWIQGWLILKGNTSVEGVFYSMPGGTFNVLANNVLLDDGGGWFENQGLLIKSNAGTAEIYTIGNLGTGVFSITLGTLALKSGGRLANQIAIAPGATLEVNNPGGEDWRVFYLENGTSVSGGGTFLFTTGKLNMIGNVTLDNLTHNGGTLNLGGASVSISRSLTCNGGSFRAVTSTLTFNGATTPTLTFSQPTTFNNLRVLTGTTLIETAAADNAIVNGTLTNDGVIRKTQAIGGAGNKTFGLTGVAMNITAQGTLASVQVDRVDSDHSNATAGAPPTLTLQTGRYWRITPTGDNYTVTLTLPHDNRAAPHVCRYTGASWDCARDGVDTVIVWRVGIAALSDWAVGVSSAGGARGNALQFDGNGDYVQIPDNATLEPATLTVEAWVKVASFTSGGGSGYQ